ncbi:translocation/assembly module TamB domain-containing protein [Treponema sp. J25]|uniref:translocation/assembly module TamB domain-containing protein n=1 Tax=Treponema sp. J25 TaxID=2094121 RepID=UPI00104C7AC5|nr:translocation/assembly module TamB domain-containing protein [Treponema sp. J25]TCW61386.1 hypothetical protein C5O22_06750 [Treponema sp. J25]
MEQQKKKDKSPSFLVVIGSFLIVLFLSSGLGVLFQRGIVARTHSIQRELLELIQEKTGFSLFYASMGANIFGNLEIHRLILSHDTEPFVVSVDRVRIVFSLGALLGGKDWKEALRRVELYKPRLELQLKEIGKEGTSSTSQGKGVPFSQHIQNLVRSFQNFSFRIVQGELLIRNDSEREIRLSSFSCSASFRSHDADQLHLQGNTVLQYKGPEDNVTGGLLRTELSYRLDVDPSLESVSGNLATTITETAYFTVQPFSVTLRYQPHEIEVKKIRDAFPYDFSFSFFPEEQRASLKVRTAQFNPFTIIKLSSRWQSVQQWIPSLLDGEVLVNYWPTRNDLSYEANLRGMVNLPYSLGPATLKVIGEGNLRSLYFSDLSLTFPQGFVQYKGHYEIPTARPEGTVALTLYQKDRTAPPFVSTVISLSKEQKDFILWSEDLQIGNTHLSALDGRFSFDGSTINGIVSTLLFKNIESYENVQVAKITLEGSYTFSDNFLQSQISLRDVPLETMQRMVHTFIPSFPEELPGPPMTCTTDIYILADHANITFTSPRIMLTTGGTNPLFLLFSMAGTNRELSIQDGRLFWTGGQLGFSGNFLYEDRQSLLFSTSFQYVDLLYTVDGELLDGRYLTLRGNYGLLATLALDPSGAVQGHFNVDQLPLPLDLIDSKVSIREYPHFSGEASFSYVSPEQWNVDITSFSFQNIHVFDIPAFSCYGSGLVSPEKLRIGFQEIRQVNQPILDGELTVTGLFQKKMKGSLALSNAITGEQYQLEVVTPEAGGLEVRLNFKGALAGRFSPTVPVKSATGELRYVADEKGQFNFSWALPTVKVLLNDQEYTLFSLGSLDNQELLSEKTSIQYGQLQGILSNIVLDRQKGVLTFTGEITGPLLGKESNIFFENRSTFTSPSSWADFLTPEFYTTPLVSVFSLTKGTWDNQPVEPFSLHYEQDRQHMLIYGGPGEAISIRLDREGNLYGSLSKPLPLNALFEGTIQNQLMNIQIHSFVVDVPSLWKYLPFQTLLTFSQGILIGDLRLSGSVQDPQIEGSVTGENLRFTLTEWITDSCTVPQAHFVVENSLLRLEPVRGIFSTGETILSTTMQFERWIPQNFQLTIQTEREKAIPYRIALLGITAKGFAYGTLSLSFTEDLFALTGNLWATNSTITYLPEELKQTDVSSSGPHITTNLMIYTDKNVAFLWPSQDFPILRAYSDAGSSLQVLSNSQTGRFSLRGTIQLRTGEVYYLQRSFFLRRGKLVFNENEIKVDPSISIQAELRDRTENGPVTITMVVDNTPLSRFIPRFESSPALSQSEILSILGQNVVGTSLQGTLLTISSDVLTQFGIMRYFEQNVRSTLGLDMFSIRTQVLQNALVQVSGVTEEGTLQKNRGIGNYFDNTTVYIGKYFGPDLFLQSLVSLKYDEQQANTFAGGLSIESEVGLELRTPLFMIEWSITPKHQEHLFMSDQSLTITWKWSF